VDWQNNGVQSLLVKPIGTQDLLRQIEALLIRQQDEKAFIERGRSSSPDPSGGEKERRAS
jgi:DNA-binding response OmpR family regulator